MEILKPLFGATSLLGIHVTSPFMNLLIHPDTAYSILQVAFPTLYPELLDVKPECLLNTKNQVFHFVSKEMFEISKPKDNMLQSLDQCVELYSKEVISILRIILPMFANGFSVQRGKIFGFGPNSEDDTKNFFKISLVSGAKKQKLDKAPVTNLVEERSVGYVKELESASKKMTIKKFDLIAQSFDDDSTAMKKDVKPAKAIKEIKLAWNERLKKQQVEGYTAQELLNTKNESTKYDCLDYLNSQNIPGPFSTAAEIHNFMKSDEESKEKNKRMKMEVKYARLMCTSMNPSKTAAFRLQRSHKDLTTDEYAENLIPYLDTARSCKKLTMNDLNNILFGIVSSVTPSSTSTSSSEYTNFVAGDHIAAFWFEHGKHEWFLGIIDTVVSDSIITVSYLKRVDVWSGLSQKRQIFKKLMSIKYYAKILKSITAFNKNKMQNT